MSTSAITQDVTELKELDLEIKRLSKELKALRKHKEACEARIIEYLDVNDQPGLKYQGVTIIAQDRKKRKYQKKSEKIEKGVRVLEKHGIYNSKEALDEILEAMRGSPEHKSALKFI